jgi:hypothetical protein
LPPKRIGLLFTSRLDREAFRFTLLIWAVIDRDEPPVPTLLKTVLAGTVFPRDDGVFSNLRIHRVHTPSHHTPLNHRCLVLTEDASNRSHHEGERPGSSQKEQNHDDTRTG